MMLVYKSFLEQLVDELSTTCTEVDFNICVSVASTIQET